MGNVKKNRGIAIQRIREILARGEKVVGDFTPSGAVGKWEAETMADLVARADRTKIVTYPKRFEIYRGFALSLSEQIGYTVVEVRQLNGVEVYVLERRLK